MIRDSTHWLDRDIENYAKRKLDKKLMGEAESKYSEPEFRWNESCPSPGHPGEIGEWQTNTEWRVGKRDSGAVEMHESRQGVTIGT